MWYVNDAGYFFHMNKIVLSDQEVDFGILCK